jgi:hypothetical protein
MKKCDFFLLAGRNGYEMQNVRMDAYILNVAIPVDVACGVYSNYGKHMIVL